MHDQICVAGAVYGVQICYKNNIPGDNIISYLPIFIITEYYSQL